MGKVFHQGCLQCDKCGRTLSSSDKLAKSEGGFPICSSCAGGVAVSTHAAAKSVVAVAPAKRTAAAPKFSNLRVCGGCGQDLGDSDALMDAGEFFHKHCFTCSECSQLLGSDFFVTAGKRHCRECYKFAMFKCFACMLPLHKHGSDVQHDGHMYHLACAPRGRPAAETSPPIAAVAVSPTPAASVAVAKPSAQPPARRPVLPTKPLPSPGPESPANSPPPSPPPPRPRWSREEQPAAPRWSGSASPETVRLDAEDDLDDLVNEFLRNDEPAPAVVPLPAPLLRTSRSSRASGGRVESCWACGSANAVGYSNCETCGEASLDDQSGTFALPEQGEVADFGSSLIRRSSVADEDQLSALILELGDI